MSRHSGAFFGDDVNSLPLHNDPHVGINMSGLDALNAQHSAMAANNPYPPSPSSVRSPHSSHGHTSSSTKYTQGASSSSSAATANYTSPRLHHSQAAAFGLTDPSSSSSERYSFDNQQQQQQPQQHHHLSSQAAYRNEGLGRSLSMGHGSHPSQSRSASHTSATGSAMYLSPQTGAAQASGSNSSSGHGTANYLSSLSPSGMRHSSFISGGGGGSGVASNLSPQSSYSGLPNLSSGSSHPASLLPAPQMLSSPYSNHSSHRSSNAMDTSGSSIRDPASGNPYSPNTSQSSRFSSSNNAASSGPSAPRAGGHDPSNFMDVSSPRDAARSPRQLTHRTSQQQLSHQYAGSGSAGLGDLSDGLPYAYHSNQAHGQQTGTAQYLSSGGRPSGGAYASSSQAAGSLWPSGDAGSGRGSMILDPSSRDRSSDSTARNSVIYSDGTSFAQHGLGIGSTGSMTTASDNSRTSSARRDAGSSIRPSRRSEGFRRVRDFDDLRPVIDKSTAAASGAAAISDGKAATAAARATSRRADPAGGFVSPLKALTAYLHHTYHLVNPAFFYELSFNPRRVLTKPSKPVQNEGRDNEESDYILYVNDWLGTEEGHKYLILDILGQGTFGQVVKCQDMTTHEIVAVKVIKNKPAYFNQSMMEVTVLEMLNGNWDPNDEHHILRLKDTFIHAKHLCLVLELLSSNLYELIKQNSFQGLSTSLVRVFTAQLLDALTVLNEARLIHCDLKPENILLKTLQTPSIKLVDFGSACHEKQTVYTYIQSRFYRSPEVLLGLPYSSAIDMWSLGCIAVELFLGLPLFPGTSEYNQICRIVEMLGLPPQWMLDNGKQTQEFFSVYTDEFGRKSYRLKSLEQYSKEHNVQEQPSKKYFKATTLPDIVKTYPMSRKSGKSADVQKEMANRSSFIDFVTGLLNMNPHERWTPQQAKLHPFITGEKFVKPFRPPLVPTGASITSASSSSSRPKTSDASKHPYGGLVQQSSSSRASNKTFQDAAAYNQHLAQQQAYLSAAARQQAQPVLNNPYAREEAANAQAAAEAKAVAKAQAAQMAQMQQQQQQYNARHSMAVAPSNYYGGGDDGSGQRRADNRLSMIPPQLAKLGLDPSLAAGQNMAGLVNRDDPLREWERRQNGLAPSSAANMSSSSKKRQSANYQQLDLLQQQAEMGGGWAGVGSGAGSGSAAWDHAMMGKGGTGGGGSFSVVVDGSQDRMGKGSGGGGIAAPPAAYSSGSGGGSGGMARYQTSPGLGYGVNGATSMSTSHSSGGGSGGSANASTLPFDIYDAGMANLLPPSLTPVRIQDRDQHLQQQQQAAQQQAHQQQAYLQYAAMQATREKQHSQQSRRDASLGTGGGGAFGGM
ncbi:Dual specificity protein kinase YAK1 [Pseudozyma hubeiensis]|nr:Dual specificity protein kinase YAK1 [Pseudozyma hubeiensis]